MAAAVVSVDHADHVRLLRDGIDRRGGVWADLGAGSGAFTLALRDLLGPDVTIYAVDRDGEALRRNEAAMRSAFPAAAVFYRTADFTRQLELPEMDGVLLANSLHFQRDQAGAMLAIRGYLKPGGRVLVVEYNTDASSGPVPYPVPYERWETLSREAGLRNTRLLHRRPSRFLREIYSAVSFA